MAAAAATAANAAPRPAFDYIISDDQRETLRHLECAVCLEYLVDGVETVCGHGFCAACVTRLRSCPTCRKPIAQQPLPPISASTRRLLDGLKVRCPHTLHGCRWTGARSDMVQHHGGCSFADSAAPLVFEIKLSAAPEAAWDRQRDGTFIFPFLQATTARIQVDWGDGSALEPYRGAPAATVQHCYAQPGQYAVRVLPLGAPAAGGIWLDHVGGATQPFVFCRSDVSDGWADRIVRFVQLGKLGVRNLRCMFRKCKKFNAGLNHLDVSHVTDMGGMFDGASSFNQPIGQWNVSNVTDMGCMFRGASSFNQPIGQWNVSNVTDMGGMFFGASSFNQPIGQWNVSNVTTMRDMFFGASSFNQPIGQWNVSNVTDMRGMFDGASSFNQPIGQWNVSNVTTMRDMFFGASSFNQPIGQWNVSNVTTMRGMFEGASSFNQPIGQWNVSNVTDMRGMFEGASSFNQPIGQWNVGNVTTMYGMFAEASSFNQYDVSIMSSW